MITLAQVISDIESTNNQYSYRFEAALFEHTPSWIMSTLPAIAAKNPIDKDMISAKAIGCASFGIYQILGANIYDRGYDRTIGEFFSDLTGQFIIFNRFVATRGFGASDDLGKYTWQRMVSFADFYNGPREPELYATAMKKTYARLLGAT